MRKRRSGTKKVWAWNKIDAAQVFRAARGKYYVVVRVTGPKPNRVREQRYTVYYRPRKKALR